MRVYPRDFAATHLTEAIVLYAVAALAAVQIAEAWLMAFVCLFFGTEKLYAFFRCRAARDRYVEVTPTYPDNVIPIETAQHPRASARGRPPAA